MVIFNCGIQVSFGEMIGCDKEDVSALLGLLILSIIIYSMQCPIEWFHFQCVGLTSKPKGKW